MVFTFVSHWLLQISAAVASVLLFFLIYWILPNRKLPVRAVLPTAIVIGLSWEVAKMLYVAALPWMDLQKVYGPFSVSVSLMLWAFVTGLLLLGGCTLLGLAPRPAHRVPGRPGTRQRRKGCGKSRCWVGPGVRVQSLSSVCENRKLWEPSGAHSRSLGYPGWPIRGFESEQRVRFSLKKIACSPVVATNLYGPSGFARDDKGEGSASMDEGD